MIYWNFLEIEKNLSKGLIWGYRRFWYIYFEDIRNPNCLLSRLTLLADNPKYRIFIAEFEIETIHMKNIYLHDLYKCLVNYSKLKIRNWSTFGFRLITDWYNSKHPSFRYSIQRKLCECALIVANLFLKPTTQSTLCTQNYPFRMPHAGNCLRNNHSSHNLLIFLIYIPQVQSALNTMALLI